VNKKGFENIAAQQAGNRDGLGAYNPERRLLLHTCCAPCAAGCIERLREDCYEVVLFYSNSNISPREEYGKRLQAVERFASIYRLELIVDEYDHERWRDAVRGFENEPEKGRRCGICFGYNLARTALSAEKLGMRCFSTTLTLSPHKMTESVFGAGVRFAGFVPINFRKKDGPKRSSEICAEYDLYRQNYCGCEFSLKTDERNGRG